MNSIQAASAALISQMQQVAPSALADVPRPAISLDSQAASPSISDSFASIFRSIDAQQTQASQMMADVDAGRSDDLLGTMLESQKASVAFSALVQVRNKVTGAFEEIMRLQM